MVVWVSIYQPHNYNLLIVAEICSDRQLCCLFLYSFWYLQLPLSRSDSPQKKKELSQSQRRRSSHTSRQPTVLDRVTIPIASLILAFFFGAVGHQIFSGESVRFPVPRKELPRRTHPWKERSQE